MADEKPEESAPEEGSEPSRAATKKSLSKRKKIIIAALGALILASAGAGVYFSGILSGDTATDAAGKKNLKKKGKNGEAERGTTGSSVKAVKQNFNEWVPGVVPGHDNDDVAYYNLPEFLVNLNTGGKQTSFVKIKITLEVASDVDTDAIDSRMPRITDSFNTYLRELRSSDLAGSAGLYRLREELLLRVNKILYPNKINDILFREIILQ